LQFEFQSLGGLMTGVEYPLMSFTGSGQFPTANMFAFAPDMAAAGWAGAFSVTPSGAFVRFTSVPEPATTGLLLLQGAAIVYVVRRRSRRSSMSARR
jgi:hypothetical protein